MMGLICDFFHNRKSRGFRDCRPQIKNFSSFIFPLNNDILYFFKNMNRSHNRASGLARRPS